MKRVEALALIRRAGYLGNFKSMIELRLSYKISHEVALKEFNLGRNIYNKEIEEINFNDQFNSDILSNG
jgi:hypothetical protein